MSLPQEPTTRSQAPVPAVALAASGAAAPLSAPLTLPGNDHSLAEMAQRDLDAALQLLTERAQYITGAQGAAIALRRGGKNDMLCRAAAGSNAPELGALLSTEFGLSGESVRTRRPLRCDDAGRDPRVNREGCRELGIASVVVMPVVNDDEVLGVFELFSGKVNAFGERDVSTLQRLSQMVETAVKLACTAEALPLPVAAEVPLVEAKVATPPAVELKTTELDLGETVAISPTAEPVTALDLADIDLANEEILEISEPVVEVVAEPVSEPTPESTTAAAIIPTPPIQVPEPKAPPDEPPKKPLFWSIAQTSAPSEPAASPDQSHVPPGLRNLSSCQACGFPVSPGRVLCVECEEKKWRGQLRGRKPLHSAPLGAAPAPSPRTMAAAASATAVGTLSAAVAPSKVEPESGKPAIKSMEIVKVTAAEAAPKVTETSDPQVPPPTFALSAGLASESWFSSKKYILAVLFLLAGAAAAVWFLR